MPWSNHIDGKGVVAIHAALLGGGHSFEGGDDTNGIILFWGGDNHVKANHDDGDWNHAALFNCSSSIADPVMNITAPTFDSFCVGHAMLDTGALLLAGGTEDFVNEAVGKHSVHFTGLRNAATYTESVFLPKFGSFGGFENTTDMNFEPGLSVGGGRWYPTLVTLADGTVFMFGGHPAASDSRHVNNTPEVYSRSSATWTLQPAIGTTHTDSTDPQYPRMYLMKDGRVFCHSHVEGVDASFATTTVDSTWDVHSSLPNENYRSFDYPSVLLPLLAGEGYQMRVLLCGTTPCQYQKVDPILSMASSPLWLSLNRSPFIENVSRKHSNATLLPDGRVVLTGGADENNDLFSTGSNPEIFTPSIISFEGHFSFDQSVDPGTWSLENDPASLLRNYHSTALLLPDGRVWTAGGNAITQPGGQPDPKVQEQIEIYSPPYPDGTRPRILSCPPHVKYGSQFRIETDQEDTTGFAVSLMRCGSCTHAWNSGQRSVWCEWTAGPIEGFMTITAPPDGNIAPPGWWMVFILDASKRPCSYARFIILNSLDE